MKILRYFTSLFIGLLTAQMSVAQTQARTCYDFVESIGVCTHWDYNNTKYVQEFNTVKTKLGQLGVRYIRDAAPIVNAASIDRSLAVYNDLGIKTLTVFSKKYYTPSQIDSKLDDLVGNTNMILAFEGPNEPDAGKDGYNDPCCWTDDLRANQRYIFNAVNNHPNAGINSKLVVAASPTFPKGVAWMGDMSAIADRYNIHSYHGGKKPEEPNSNFAQYLDEIPAVHTDGQARWRIWATEAGNHNQETGPKSNGISEEGEAKYINRMLLYYFSKGIQKTFNYELVDLRAEDPNDNQDNFGLLRHNLTEKPTFRALKNLITILDDNTDFTAGSFNYRLSSSSGIEQVLLQKSDGKFYLVLWQNESVYNPNTDTNIENDSRLVTITANIASAKVYLPLVSVSEVNTFGASDAITVLVPDHPILVEITPGQVSAGTYYLKNRESGRRIRPQNNGAGVQLQLGSQTGSSNDYQWEITEAPGDPGYYFLRNVASGMYFRPDNQSTAAGIKVETHQWTGNGTMWQIKPAASNPGWYYLESKVSPGMEMRNNDCGTSSGTMIETHNGTGNCVQWALESVGNARTEGSVAEKTIAIEEAVATGNRIYPNPVVDVLKLPGLNEAEVRILSLEGRQMLYRKLDQYHEADVSSLPTGMYILNVTRQGEQLLRTKIIKQ